MNYELRITNWEKGFTLIELLASTVVIVTVGIIIVAIIISSLRGNNKTNALSVSRQNGNYAISQMSKMLRFARSIDAIGNQSASKCTTNAPFPSIQPTPVSGFALATSLTYTNLDGDVRTIACLPLDVNDANSPLTIASMSGTLPPGPITIITGSLLDNSAVRIPEGMCHITCNQSTSSDAMIVGITFSLDTVRPTGSLLPEFAASQNPIEFTTSVILRNLGR